MKICTKCHREYKDDSVTFCAYCGIRLTDKDSFIRLEAEQAAKRRQEQRLAQLSDECSAISDRIYRNFAPYDYVIPYSLRAGLFSFTKQEEGDKTLETLQYYEDVLLLHQKNTAATMYDELDRTYRTIRKKYAEALALNKQALGPYLYQKHVYLRDKGTQAYLTEAVNAYLVGGEFSVQTGRDTKWTGYSFEAVYSFDKYQFRYGADKRIGDVRKAQGNYGLAYLCLKIELGTIESNLDDALRKLQKAATDKGDAALNTIDLHSIPIFRAARDNNLIKLGSYKA